MRTLYYIAAIQVILGLAVSCGSSDNGAKLEKLKKQQASIEERIRSLENSKVEKTDSLDPAKFRLVGVSVIEPGAFDHYIKVQGKLDGDENVSVYAEVPGTISRKYADVGQRVREGEVLAQIDDTQLRLQLENLKTQYRLAADLYEKQKRLWEQKIGSEVQYLQSETTKQSLEQQISLMEDQIEKYKIKSPISGSIEEANIKAGSVVSPDPRAAAYRVVAFRQLKVSAEISEAYASKVKTGDKVIIEFPDLGREVVSKVDFVSRYVNPVNRTFIVESSVDEGLPGMKANMIAIIKINDYHSDNSMILPMNIILSDLNGSYVYVARNKDGYFGAYRQPVKIGNSYNGVAEIIEGLEPSSKVITTGFRELIEGEYVRFEDPAAELLTGK